MTSPDYLRISSAMLAGPPPESKGQIEQRLGIPAAPTDKVNIYVCKANPTHWIKVILRDSGTTPFALGCLECDEMAHSTFFQKPPDWHPANDHEPTHEFYRPDTTAGLSESNAEWVKSGCLLFRQIK